MPKSAQRFSGDIMLALITIDHVHDFGSVDPKSSCPTAAGANPRNRIGTKSPLRGFVHLRIRKRD
ncbi:MAG: hypothetical protein AB7K04_14650, partial [Pseudorhodoplanes sp.]